MSPSQSYRNPPGKGYQWEIPVEFLLGRRWEGLAAQICEGLLPGVDTRTFLGTSRVRCACVRSKLVECSLKGKGNARTGGYTCRHWGKRLCPIPGCVILGRCLNPSGPLLVNL